MPLFAFANAGLTLSTIDPTSAIAVAIFFGFVIGKPLGIVSFSWLAVRFGVADKSIHLTWRCIFGGGALAGIGFTMALFIASHSFSDELLDNSKLGIFVASIFSAILGFVVLRWLNPSTADTSKVSKDNSIVHPQGSN